MTLHLVDRLSVDIHRTGGSPSERDAAREDSETILGCVRTASPHDTLETDDDMDYRDWVKKLRTPPGFDVPTELVFEDMVATAITRHDLADDVAGINASIDIIRRTRGGPWPEHPVSEAFNFVDLVWHELEFRDGTSFTYVLRDAGGQYLGCCYLYPMGRRTELTDELIRYDVDISWWVTKDAYERGRYTDVHRALQHWLGHELSFWKPYFSNAEPPA